MLKKLALTLVSIIISLTGLAPLDNATAVGTNLIANPSVETADTIGALPASWTQNKWGTNTTAFTYKTTEGNAGTKSLYINMTKRTSGDAKWKATPVSVKPNQKYTYSEFYKSNVATEIDIEYASTAGKLSYVWLGTTAASSTNWQTKTFTFTTPANVKTLTVFHVINKVGWLQTDNFSLTEAGTTPAPTPTPPTVSITAPSANSTVNGLKSLSASASDQVGVSGVQFKVNGTAIGAEDTTTPYSIAWDSKTVANGTHTVSATARNTSNLTTTASLNINVQNPTPPAIAITTPANNATVSGNAQVVSANANDTVGVTGVQFKLDNVNLGAESATAPYNINWDTTTVANGNHTLNAVARNSAGLTTTSTVVVNVQNAVTPPPNPTPTTNLIPNPSFETAENATTPQNWLASNWGTNTPAFTYMTSGHTGSRSVKTEITSYTNGAANWYYNSLSITSGKSYVYENWYQSNVDSEVDVEVTMNDGSVQYYYLASAPQSSAWAKVSGIFTAPAGAKSIAIYQILAKKGYVITDDYSLSEYTPAQFNRPLVSLTFDDGWRSIYTNGLPLLNKYGFVSTQYLLSETIEYPDYMTIAMMQAFRDQGSEIAAHTVSHANLTTLNATQLNYELSQNKTELQNWLGVTVNNFASPYGAYNNSTINATKQYYRSHRSTDVGYNSKDSFNIYNIKVQNILNTTTAADVQAWVAQAAADKTWLVLVYHEVGTNNEDPVYSTTPTFLDQHLATVKQSGIAVVTINQALNEIVPQL